ncbi:Ribosomal large subunit pseudouridine synthase D [hydrothermal vent metagenome]|uniref:Ribosomal large subunit pseudouridine synthase D n=1 Tax=hydrothermal vent metagenome TaxID=652676 RepID=A0A3B1DJH4_9ZZZZ
MAAPTPNERVTFRVAHEDDDLLVVVKRARLVTTIGIGHEDDTLLNGLMARYPKQLARLGASRDWGLVHRLDRGTSGLIVVALSPDAYDGLRELFESRSVRKLYWALCRSTPNKPAGVIKRPIIEEIRKATKYTSTKTARIGNSGKPAVTAYRVLQSSPAGSLIEARPVTGRLHQVRVHLDSIAATVLGDEFYGPAIARAASKRLALHAHRLAFTHPITGDELDLRTSFPRDLRPLLKRMRLERPDLAEHEIPEE